ncbi:MAG TPA: iron-containing alcohol dehydrogenase [Woeseiaceae bacterium]|nr:iron-containing alcohol dehydrogenase [Woeseiaceae bacterium]
MRTIAFFNPRKLAFGPEAYDAFRQDVKEAGFRRLFVVSIDALSPRLEELNAELHEADIACEFDFSIVNEPTFAEFERLLERARRFRADCVVGIGGGSVMDVAKLLAAQLTNTQSVPEIVGIDNLAGRATALICLPTTSGTGSEVSPNALFTSDDGSKVGVISRHLVPDAAYVCPELTVSVPPAVTAATGIDALTHCLEAYANNFAHPMVDVLAIEGIRLIAKDLPVACRDGSNLEARTNVALGSVYGGMCLGPVNTGAVHALAYPLGTQFHVPHGLSNALLLPYVMEFNLPEAEARYAAAARAMGAAAGASERETAVNGIQKVRELIRDCGLPSRLSEAGIPEAAIERLAEGALKVQRLLRNNPRHVTLEDAKAIYRAAF